jgi:hypothetical protein
MLDNLNITRHHVDSRCRVARPLSASFGIDVRLTWSYNLRAGLVDNALIAAKDTIMRVHCFYGDHGMFAEPWIRVTAQQLVDVVRMVPSRVWICAHDNCPISETWSIRTYGRLRYVSGAAPCYGKRAHCTVASWKMLARNLTTTCISATFIPLPIVCEENWRYRFNGSL